MSEPLASERTQLTPAFRQIGGYECLAVLSSGGMGQVLLCRKAGLHGFERLVAVKTIREELAADAYLRAMFLDEARLMARLVHPAIAQVQDFGEDGHTLYLVMEYVPGVSLRGLGDTRLPPLIAARAIQEICLGLHAAHELKDLSGAPLAVVHRDVSPENLMLTFEGTVKILDFGIALVRDRQARETVLGHIKGKPAYMSPEQVNNDPVDRRSDVFSAGIVLHELLTGRQLFCGESMLGLAMAIARAEVPRPSAVDPSVPGALDDIVLRALSREPQQRYDTALAMAEALEAVFAESRAEGLEAFARRELAVLRDQHRDWLGRVVSSRASLAPVPTMGRPEGISTAMVSSPVAPDTIHPEPSEPLVVESVAPSSSHGLAAPPRSHSRARLAVGMGVALLAAAFAVAVQRSGHEAPQMARTSTSHLNPADGRLVQLPQFPFPKAPIASAQGSQNEPKTRPFKAPPSPAARAKPAPKPPVPVDPQSIEKGKLTLGAEPYAWVRIDGKMVGSSPLMGYFLTAGEHQITLIRPEDGTVRHQETVSIEAGGHRHMLIKQ